MYLYQMGWHWKHGADFALERPSGLHGAQLLLICTKARVRMGTTEFDVEPNTAFLVQSSVPHALCAAGGEYMDDWIRFTPEQEDHAFMDSLDLAWHVPIPLSDDTLSQMIAACVKVSEADLPNKNQILHHMMTAALLYLNEVTHPRLRTKKSEYDRKLEEIRRGIYADPGHDWTVPELAAELCVSVSHFQRLYKAKYGISCTQEIFISRMEYAKQLLLETTLSAGEIAEKCGYQNYEYFSKSFAKYGCMSPVKYRQTYQEAGK